MTKPGRIACEVLGCRRTASVEKYGQHTKICCGKCWRTGRAEFRTRYRQANRALRCVKLAPEVKDALAEAAHQAFCDVVRSATEARAGL